MADHASTTAARLGSESVRLRAEVLAVFACNQLGRGAAAGGRALRAFVAARAAGEETTERLIRVELAACAADASAPAVGLSVLRPTLDRGASSAATARAAAFVTAADCVARLGGGPEVAALLRAADELYDTSRSVEPDAVLLRRGVVHARLAAYHRRLGDHDSAESAARLGLALVEELADEELDTGQVSGALVAELVLALLDGGRAAEAVLAAQPVLRRPTRPAGAATSCWLRIALVSRVHLPAGRHVLARRLLAEAAADAERNQLDPVLAECRQLQARVFETCAEVGDALQGVRAAYIAERRWRDTAAEFRTLLAAEFGRPAPAAELRSELAGVLASFRVTEFPGRSSRTARLPRSRHAAPTPLPIANVTPNAIGAGPVDTAPVVEVSAPADRFSLAHSTGPVAGAALVAEAARLTEAARVAEAARLAEAARADEAARVAEAARAAEAARTAEAARAAQEALVADAIRADEATRLAEEARAAEAARLAEAARADEAARLAEEARADTDSSFDAVSPLDAPLSAGLYSMTDPGEPVGSGVAEGSEPPANGTASTVEDLMAALRSAMAEKTSPATETPAGEAVTEPLGDLSGSEPAQGPDPWFGMHFASSPDAADDRPRATDGETDGAADDEDLRADSVIVPASLIAANPANEPTEAQRAEAQRPTGSTEKPDQPGGNNGAEREAGRHRSDVAMADLLAEALMAYQNGRRSELAAAVGSPDALDSRDRPAHQHTTGWHTEQAADQPGSRPDDRQAGGWLADRPGDRQAGGWSAEQSAAPAGPVTPPEYAAAPSDQSSDQRFVDAADRARSISAMECPTGPMKVPEPPRRKVRWTDLPRELVWREPGRGMPST